MVLSEATPVGDNCMVRNEWICPEYLTSRAGLLTDAMVQHVWITVVSVVIGLVIAVPLALLARRYPKLEGVVVGTTTAIYTIPSLALFALLVPLSGLSAATVIAGLALYSLTILVRYIVEGLNGISADVIEAAQGMGYGARRLLLTVELPLALPSVMAGLRVAFVSTVALTTVGSIVSYGGLGNLLLEAVNTQFKPQVFTASVLCVLLAFVFDLLIVGTQRLMTPWARTRAV
ncbi:MAG TPA: ABC transporter permease [Nocardioidaceae bacterium]|nr:ABC transporter permease [Nocardioidaceae bacterium]